MVDRERLTRSLSRRRAAFTGLAALLALAIMAAIYGMAMQSTLSRRAEQENLAANLAQAEMGALFVSDHQARLLERLQAIAGRTVFRQAFAQGDMAQMASFLTPLTTRRHEVAASFVAGPQGRCRLSVPALPDFVLRPPEQSRPRPWVSSLHDEAGEGAVVTLGVPILRKNELVGFLGLHQRPSFWATFLAQLTARPGRTYHLIDQDGHMVAAGPKGGLTGPQEREALARAVRHTQREQGRPAAWLAPVPGSTWRAFAAAAPVEGLGWTMVVLQDYASAMAPAQALYRGLLIFLAALVLCILALGWMMHQRHRMQRELLSKLDQEARDLEGLVAERTEELAASTRRWRNLLEDLPDVVYDLDAQGRVTFVSRSIQRVLGYRPDEVRGNPWRSLVLPEEIAKLDQEKRRLKPGAPLSVMALRHLTKDGGIRWLSIHSRDVYGPGGEPEGRRGVARDVTAEVTAQMRVRELSARLMWAQEDERKRIALDLHDEMGQLLSALKLGLQAVSGRLEGDEKAEMERLIRLSQNVTDRVRALAYRLRPSILDNFGLAPALEDLCESLSESGLMTVEHRLEPVSQGRLTPEQEIVLFRFAQEALTNAVKHAGTPRARVELRVAEGWLRLSVRDWGRGFDPERVRAQSHGLGLHGMADRLDLIAGRLIVESSNQGSLLTAEAPLEETP